MLRIILEGWLAGRPLSSLVLEEKQIWKMISERVCLGWDDCFSHLCSWQLGPIDGNSDNFFIIVMMVVMVIIRIMITLYFHGFASNTNKLVGGSEYIVLSMSMLLSSHPSLDKCFYGVVFILSNFR